MLVQYAQANASFPPPSNTPSCRFRFKKPCSHIVFSITKCLEHKPLSQPQLSQFLQIITALRFRNYNSQPVVKFVHRRQNHNLRASCILWTEKGGKSQNLVSPAEDRFSPSPLHFSGQTIDVIRFHNVLCLRSSLYRIINEDTRNEMQIFSVKIVRLQETMVWTPNRFQDTNSKTDSQFEPRKKIDFVI